MKPPHAANDNLIDRTRRVWEPRLGRDLSREDARQIAENVSGFFTLLAKWLRAELPAPANENGGDSASKDEEEQPEAVARDGGRG